MKHILLPENLNYYRVNLHSHSTISDGKKTVEELKRDYMAHGYSAVAFTDHEIFLTHNDLTDENFVALNGYEISFDDGAPKIPLGRKTCHICLVALDGDNNTQVCYNREKYLWGNAVNYRDKIVFDETKPDFIKHYDPQTIQQVIDTGREHGFFVTYNHPDWSRENFENFTATKNLNAMEIVNFSSAIHGYDDDNGHCYNDMLNVSPLFCVATDDNHNREADNDPRCDSYGGYTLVGAEKLGYKELTDALSKGCFYASTGNYIHTGPQIKSLEYEEGTVRIKTSPVASIQIITASRNSLNCVAPEGETIEYAEFNIREKELWFRLVARDTKGYKAYTNAYFPDKLNEE